MRRIGMAVACLGLVLVAGSGKPAKVEEEFPAEIVQWVPIEQNPVFQGAGGEAWDKQIRERGWILVRDGVYHLWYTGYNEDRSPLRMLGHATSPDGVKWTRDSRNPLVSDSWVEDMCVVVEGGAFWMFAEGENDIAHLLTSPDGIEWTERGPLDVRKADGSPISPGPRGTPTVWVENGVWTLLYERGDRGVWLARSEDAGHKVWVNVQDDPVLPMGPDRYDSQAVAVNQVVKRGDTYYTFYHANSERPWKDWTTCVARSKDLIHWEKYPGNPIVENNSSSGLLVESPQGTRLFTMHPEVRVYVNPPADSNSKP